MKLLQPTTQYRKDLKRYKNQPSKLQALAEVLVIVLVLLRVARCSVAVANRM